jgi:biopolymer transport protein ExbD
MAGAAKSGDEDVVSDINIVPLVDVILVLLIVFMITMPTIVGSAPIKVDVPENEAAALKAEALPLRFALKRTDSGVALFLEDQPTNMEKLKSVVKDIVPESTEVSLAADRTIPYGEVVKVMDMLGSLGLHKIALDTKNRSG